jgi:hypothetical protein
MVRSIIAVVASYLTMFVLGFIGFSCAFFILGSEVVFKPRIFEASTTWIAIGFVINIVEALFGGFLCALIAKGGRAPLALAVLAVVLALAVAVADMNKGKTNAGLVRVPNMPAMEVVQKAYWPVWVPFVFPFTSAIGILIGAKLRRRP